MQYPINTYHSFWSTSHGALDRSDTVSVLGPPIRFDPASRASVAKILPTEIDRTLNVSNNANPTFKIVCFHKNSDYNILL